MYKNDVVEKNSKILFLFVLLLISACTKSIQHESQVVSEDPIRKAFMEKSINEIGGIISVPGVIGDIQRAIQVNRDEFDNDEQVLFAELIDKNSEIRKKMSPLKSNPGQNTFASVWAKQNELQESGNSLDELTEYFLEQKMAFYFPYSENFDGTDISGFTLSYFDLVNEDFNDGIFIAAKQNIETTSDFGYVIVDRIDDYYTHTHPTLILYPEGMSEQDILDGLDDSGDDGSFPAPISGKVELTYNVNHNTLREQDVVTTAIPRIRLNKQTRGVFGGGNKITLYRVDGAYTIDANVGLVGVAENPVVIKKVDFKIKRNQVGKWVDFNAEFDRDWDRHEAMTSLVMVTRHWFKEFGVDYSVNAKVELGEAKSTGKWIAPIEDMKIEAAVSVKLSLGKNYKLHANNELSRREVFLNIVGKDVVTGKSYVEKVNGVDVEFAVRSLGDLDFYFRHYYTKL